MEKGYGKDFMGRGFPVEMSGLTKVLSTSHVKKTDVPVGLGGEETENGRSDYMVEAIGW